MNAVTNFTSTKNTNENLLKLERLAENPRTNNLMTDTEAIIQNVEHANDTLKQLQKMIDFNMKLMRMGDKSNEHNKHNVIVPIKKISLHPLIPEEPGKAPVAEEKTATKASDLDNTAQEAEEADCDETSTVTDC